MNHAGAENRRSTGFVYVALAHLEQAGIQRLHANVGVDFFRALALQDHAGNACDVVPHGEIGDQSAAGESEDVVSFERRCGVIRKDLSHADASVAVIDHDVDRHFIERQPLRFGLLGVGRNQHAGVGPHCARGEENDEECARHH